MKKFILTFAFALLSATSSFAAIGCLPGHCGPGGTPLPDDGLTPPHAPTQPTVYDGSGYFEVASPNCSEEDLITAQRGAVEKAFINATWNLGTEEITQISAPRYLIQKCEQSIYAGSFKGNSWIIYAVVGYKR